MTPQRTFLTLLTVASSIVACGGEGVTGTSEPDHPRGERISQALTTTFSNPYPGAGVTVIAGRAASDGNSWLVFWRTTDAHCTWRFLGRPSLTGDVTILLDDAAFAEVALLGPGQTKGVACSNFVNGETFNGAVSQGAFFINAFGSPGADYFNCTGGGETFCDGRDGNDIFDSHDDKTEIRGGSGNDKIRFTGLISNRTWIHGQGGADCLQLPVKPATIGAYDCGADWVDWSTHMLGAGCEQQVPWGMCND